MDSASYQERFHQRKATISDEVLSYVVTADALEHLGLNDVYNQLNVDIAPIFPNWRTLADKLLQNPPNAAEAAGLSRETNPTKRVLESWITQSDGTKTFEYLISTMFECELYSSCDALFDFLETFDPRSPTRGEQFCINASNNARGNEEREQSERRVIFRSQSLPENRMRRLRRGIRQLFRLHSAEERSRSQTPSPSDDIPRSPFVPEPVQDEIFIVSSNTDNQTNAMKALMSFLLGIKPVRNGELQVKTIHDLDQQGRMTTFWLEERVKRAKYVLLCFSTTMKAIADCAMEGGDYQNYLSQTEYNLKYTLDFLVTGRIYYSLCRNPGGKFVPIILHGQSISNIITPLRFFLHFAWPNDSNKISKYIMNLPEYPVPRQGIPKRLVVKPLGA